MTPRALLVVALFLAGCPSTPLPYPTKKPAAVPGAEVVLPAPQLQADLSNVANPDRLKRLSAAQKLELGRHGMLVLPSAHKEFFQAYINNRTPLVTSDSLLHAYHILTEDSIENCERLVLQPHLLRCLEAAWPALQGDRQAMAMVGTLRGMLDPDWKAPYSEAPAASPAPRLDQFVDYEPPANRAGPAIAYASQRALDLDKDEDLRTALILTYAIQRRPDDWRQVLRWQAWLSGAAEDLSPESLFHLAQPIYGSQLDLQDGARWAALKQAVAALPLPRVVDHGTTPRRSFRLIPPGVTAKSLAFQQAVDSGQRPGANEVLSLLQKNPDGDDLHSSTLNVLSSLHQLSRFGAIDPATWQLKGQNCQLGSWTELEHALGAYTKDNNYYIGGYDIQFDFDGYAEPNPAFYEKLRELAERTRTGLEISGVFEEIGRDTVQQTIAWRRQTEVLAKEMSLANAFPAQPASVSFATRAHFVELEKLLVDLRDIAECERQDRPFTATQKAVFKEFPEKLKHLSLIESNVDEPPQPLGRIVPILHNLEDKQIRYAAIGRPLEIMAVVPYQGKLFLTEGSIYSFYQLDLAETDPISDTSWQSAVAPPLSAQAHSAWLAPKPEVMDLRRTKEWVAAHMDLEPAWNVWGGGPSLSGFLEGSAELQELPSLSLSAESQEIAAEAFASPRMMSRGRPVLYSWFVRTPRAAPTGARALRAILKEFPDTRNLSSEPARLWLILSLRLIDGHVPPQAQADLRKLRDLTAGSKDGDIAYLNERIQELLTYGRVPHW